jgi:hypothetical protein
MTHPVPRRPFSIFRPFGDEAVVEYRLEQQHPSRNEVSMFQTRNWYVSCDYVELGWKRTALTQHDLDMEANNDTFDQMAIKNNWWGRGVEAQAQAEALTPTDAEALSPR